MTKTLFLEWLMGFNNHLRVCGKDVFLLIENCSAHGKDDIEELHLANKCVFLLPSITKSILHPCDAWIIAVVKSRYRRLQISR